MSPLDSELRVRKLEECLCYIANGHMDISKAKGGRGFGSLRPFCLTQALSTSERAKAPTGGGVMYVRGEFEQSVLNRKEIYETRVEQCGSLAH